MYSDSLALWGVLRDDWISSISYGTVAARSSDDITFRVKNLSHRYTAHGVVVDFDETYSGASQLYLSVDGATFVASLALGDLPASAVSPIFTLRRVTPSAASGTYFGLLRVRATGGWTPPPSI